MRETGTQISHNPSSNAKLGNGIARVPEMLAAGINVGLGHDAAECNNSRDLFEVMKFASLIHRASRVDPSLQQAPDVVRMATRNGSAALGHETGRAHGRQEGGRDPGRPAEPDVHAAATPRARRTCTRTWCSRPTAAPCTPRSSTARSSTHDRQFTTIDEPKVLREANVAFRDVLGPDGRSLLSANGRTLVLGDPIVALGERGADPRRRADRRGPRRSSRRVRAPSWRRAVRSTACSDRPTHFVMPGFINCHYHSELAIGPGLYQFIFERANVFIQAATGDIEEEDLYTGVLWGLVNAIKGGQTADGRHVLRPPGHARLRLRAGAPRLRGRRHAHRVRAREPRPEHLRPRAERAVPRAPAGRARRRRSGVRRWATRGRSTT